MRCILFAIFMLASLSNAATKLGAWYTVIHDNSPYVAEEGDKSLKKLSKGLSVRLIKNETVAETVVLFPLRVLKLMIAIEPRGNWLVEYAEDNRGYMWDSDLEPQ